MKNKEQILKVLSSFIENGILSSQDIKKEILTSLKFQKDDLIEKFDLVSREEFNILRKIVIKQDTIIKKLSKKKNIKKAKRS
jgi:BMFP domain-containing protein YqiC